jgi:cysteine desulfurase
MGDGKKNIYFDNNSTTPISGEILDEYIRNSLKYYGNPSSITSEGREAKALLIQSRKMIAKFFDCLPQEITFTSGGTESLYTIIKGICAHREGQIITTSIEHKAVLEAVKSVGKKVVYLPVNFEGIASLEDIKREMEEQTAAIVLSLVNGETGAVLPLKEISEISSRFNIPLIIDGVAALGRMPIILYPGVTAAAFSGHKCHGPKGTGFFYLKEKTPFTPLFKGGNQENGKRAGTENVVGIHTLATAINHSLFDNYELMRDLRDYFEEKVKEIFPECGINGEGKRITNVSNLYFKDVDGDHLLMYLDQNGVTASLGSACSSGSLEPSHVLLGMGYGNSRARSSLRFSFSKLNTMDEINKFCDILISYKKEYYKKRETCQNP